MSCTRTTRSSEMRRSNRASARKRWRTSASWLQLSARTLITTGTDRAGSHPYQTVAKAPTPMVTVAPSGETYTWTFVFDPVTDFGTTTIEQVILVRAEHRVAVVVVSTDVPVATV